jgi:hypothetical protein
MTADYQALSTVICQKFERMSKVASTGNYSLSPPQDRATGRLSLLHTDAYRGTLRVQFGNNSGTDMLIQ